MSAWRVPVTSSGSMKTQSKRWTGWKPKSASPCNLLGLTARHEGPTQLCLSAWRDCKASRFIRSCSMTKYRLAIAALWSIGVVALLCLLMNLNWFIGLLLIPSGLVVFAVGFLAFRTAGLTQVRRIAAWSVLPVTVLVSLACVPAMNPLWPHGMADLAKQESELQTAIPVGSSLGHVRGVLNAKKIQFHEFGEPTGGLVLENRDTTINAQAGDAVLVSRFPTEAYQFPCGYDMQIILLFGHEG